MNLLSHAFSIGCKEWKWIAASPTKDVSRPRKSPARKRRIQDQEIERMCFALGYDGGKSRAMRAGEIVSPRCGQLDEDPISLVGDRSCHGSPELSFNSA